jgi:alcohol dehydrogenase-like protein
VKAAVLGTAQNVSQHPLRIAEVAQPKPNPGQRLLKVRACGICRTDLHIVEGELTPQHDGIIPGHQIVGEIVEGATAEFPAGSRVGVSWIGGIDGTCPIANEDWKTSAMTRRTPGIPCPAVMPSMPSLGRTLSCPCPPHSMTCKRLLYCVPELSVFAVCASRKSSRGNASGSMASGRRPISPSPCSRHGIARCMSPAGVHRIANSRHLSVPPG